MFKATIDNYCFGCILFYPHTSILKKRKENGIPEKNQNIILTHKAKDSTKSCLYSKPFDYKLCLSFMINN